jgi:hypothetical protein
MNGDMVEYDVDSKTSPLDNTLTHEEEQSRDWANTQFYIYSDMHTYYSNASPAPEATGRFTPYMYHYSVIHIHVFLPLSLPV